MAEAVAPPEPFIWTEPVRGGFPDARLFGLSGLEQMRTFLRGRAPKPPIHHLTGMVPTEAGQGAATFTMPATSWLLSPPGLVQLGTLAILADGPLGTTVQTALPPLTGYATAELSMNYLRPVTAASGTLICRGRLIMAGRSLGLSEAVMEDGQGRLVAHGTSRCVLFPPMGPPPPTPPDLPEVEEPSHHSPDPYLRPVTGEVLPQETWDRMSGLEIMQGLISGDLPAPPISHLTGLWAAEAEEGATTFTMPATGWLCSPLGTVEGGVIALLADAAIVTSVQTTVPAGTSYAPIDLKVNFLRPVQPDGRAVTSRGSVVHRGRTMAVARADLTDADGKRVAVATGTSMILPGRPWHPERPVIPADDAAGDS